jgi:ABC-type transport system substrate-binding protein
MLMISPSAWQAHEQNNDRGQQWAAENIVGSSAYVIQSRVKGSRTVMKKWPGYWRGWKGKHVDTVVVDVAADAATRKLMLTSGQAVEANTIAPTDLADLSRNPDIVVTHIQAPGVQMAGVRFSGPTADVNVRRALTYAFDSVGFIKSALSGRGDLARGLIYPQFPYFDKSMPTYKLDLDRAKKYLADSAYPKGGFSLKFLIIPGFAPYQSDMAAVWQEGLKQLDIDLEIQPMASVASFYASVQDPKGADLWAWSGAAQTPDHVFQARRQWATGYEYPRGVNGGYSNNQFDGLINRIAATDDPKKLKPMWTQAQQILARDLPFIPFFIPQIYAVRRKGWNGLPQNPFDLVPNYYRVSKA